MRATIDITGMLTVFPESEVEAYALRCYAEKFNSDTQPVIRFQWQEICSPGDIQGMNPPSSGGEVKP